MPPRAFTPFSITVTYLSASVDWASVHISLNGVPLGCEDAVVGVVEPPEPPCTVVADAVVGDVVVALVDFELLLHADNTNASPPTAATNFHRPTLNIDYLP
jgi:hypothetical protein